MKLNWIILCGLALVSSQAWSADQTVLKTDKDKLSYSLGASIGKNLRKESADIDLDLLIQGMKASMAGDKVLMSDKDIGQIMNDYQMKLRKTALLNRQEALAENKKKGDAYLAEYKTKKGVSSLPSGVLYSVIKEGKGKKPLDSDAIEVYYSGTLINGKQFDATEPGHPATLKVSSLIAGWKQALTSMPAGSKWHIVIPSQLAYGERGVGNDIGPNEVLVFDVELVAVK